METVGESITGAENDGRDPVDLGVARRRPVRVHDVLTDPAGLFGDEFTGLFVDGDETGSGRSGDVDVRPVNPVRGAGEDVVTRKHGGAGSHVVGEDAQFGTHVISPDDITALRSLVDRLGLIKLLETADNILCFFQERSVVAITETVGVEADDFTTVGNDVAVFAVEENGGTNAEVFPVRHFASLELRHAELPVETATLLVEGHDNAVIALHHIDAGLFVVGPDKDLPLINRGSSVGLGAELGDPFGPFCTAHFAVFTDLTRGDVDGDVFGRRKHVLGTVPPPLGPLATALVILGGVGAGFDFRSFGSDR